MAEGYLKKCNPEVNSENNNNKKFSKYNYVLDLSNVQTKRLVWALSYFSKEFNITGELEGFRITWRRKVWNKEPAELRRQIERNKELEKYAVSIKTSNKWLT